MNWFKMCLLIILGIGVVINIQRTGKDGETETINGKANAISAIINMLLLIGVWAWL